MMSRVHISAVAVTLVCWLSLFCGCGPQPDGQGAQEEIIAAETRQPPPDPDLSGIGSAPRERIQRERGQLLQALARPGIDTLELGDAHGRLGMLYQAFHFRNEAAACYLRARILNPHEFRWHYYLARVYQNQMRLNEAHDILNEALKIRPDHVPSLTAVAEYARKHNDLAAAAKGFNQALALKKDCVTAQVGLIQIALSEKEYSKALELLARALENQPHSSVLHYLGAMAHRGLGDMAAAEKSMELRNRYREATNLEDALMEKLNALRNMARQYLSAGDEAYRTGDMTAAVRAYQRAVDEDPNNYKHQVKLGTALLKLGDRQAALNAYGKALVLSPGDAAVRYNLGGILLDLDRDDEAAEQFRQAIRQDPQFADAYQALADAARRQGRFEKALAGYEKAVELEPDSFPARLGRALVLARLGRYATAKQRLQEDLSAIPGHPVLRHTLARILASSPDAAVRDGVRALGIASELSRANRNLELAETLAMAHAETGRFDEARRIQWIALQMAGSAGRAELEPFLRKQLQDYQQNLPCRKPWRDEDPLFFLKSYGR